MARAYSMDLRERAVRLVNAGRTVRAVAALLNIAVSSVVKWSQLYRATGSVAPAAQGGWRGPPALDEANRAYIRARLADEAHVTLRGLQGELAARGVKVSYGAIWNFVHAEGLSFKKNRHRGGTGQTGRRAQAAALASSAGPARPETPGLHR